MEWKFNETPMGLEACYVGKNTHMGDVDFSELIAEALKRNIQLTEDFLSSIVYTLRQGYKLEVAIPGTGKHVFCPIIDNGIILYFLKNERAGEEYIA